MYNLLLLCNRPAEGTDATNIIEHIDALKCMSNWSVYELSMHGKIPENVDLNRFDAIGIHYTLGLSSYNNSYYLCRSSIDRLARFKGLKCVWLQDEYRRTDRLVLTLREIKIDVVFTLAEGKTLNAIFPKESLPGIRIETVLPGYVPTYFLSREKKPIYQRPIDVSYRARRSPFWLGYLGQEKINIGAIFSSHPATKGLNLNISVEEYDRLYGEDWINFLSNSKTILCAESGSSFIDFSGSLEVEIIKACAANKALTFEEISKRYLGDIDGKYIYSTISPRVFEAVTLRTVVIAFVGKHSGIMKPWEHYIPLEKDFSNINEVVAAVKDTDLLEKIADNAWKEIACVPEYSYDGFASKCGRVLSEEMKICSYTSHIAYSKKEFNKALMYDHSYLFHWYIARRLQGVLLSSRFRKYVFWIVSKMPLSLVRIIRPVLKIISR